jgi:hypothetical protein
MNYRMTNRKNQELTNAGPDPQQFPEVIGKNK